MKTNDPLALIPMLHSVNFRWMAYDIIPGPLCEFGHQGLIHDDESGLVYNRARMLHTNLGRFMQRDPLRYVDSSQLYQYIRSIPTTEVDPEGSTPKLVGRAPGVIVTMYFGPWKCRQDWVDDCKKKCADQKLNYLGCIWLADIKVQLATTTAEVGTRAAFTHCCCDYPKCSKDELDDKRKKWDNARDKFRDDWDKKSVFKWPKEGGQYWPGHHIWDLLHGGDPTDPENLIPVPPDVHKVINSAYKDCYGGAGGWGVAGPDRPYED